MEVVLARSSDCVVKFILDDLHSADHFPLELSGSAIFKLNRSMIGLFCDSLMADRTTVGVSEIYSLIAETVKNTGRSFNNTTLILS